MSESNDEIRAITDKLQSAVTIEATTCHNVQQQGKSLSLQQKNNNVTIHQSQDSKKSCTATTMDDNNLLVRNLPELNLPEKILFVIDTVKEQQCTPFKLGTGATYPPLFMIKRVVENFVNSKSILQSRHEYALMILDSQSSSWVCDYTNNTKIILNHLEGIAEATLDEEQKTYDFGQVFEKIHSRIPIPSSNQATIPPTFASRVILIYGRSNSIPKFHSGQKYLKSLTDNPYFFLDVLFVHEPPSDDNMCETVYSEIIALDTKNFSYIYEVGRNAATIHNIMAKLLAHPLQRPPQKDTSYILYSTAPNQEVHTSV